MRSDATTCSCAVLRQASRRLTRLYDEALAPCGLSLNQYALLRTIERGQPATLGALAAEMVMDRSTVGHLLRPLASRGWLSIELSPDSARERRPVLTANGRALLRDAAKLRDAAEIRFATLFGAEDLASLHELLRRVANLPI